MTKRVAGAEETSENAFLEAPHQARATIHDAARSKPSLRTGFALATRRLRSLRRSSLCVAVSPSPLSKPQDSTFPRSRGLLSSSSSFSIYPAIFPSPPLLFERFPQRQLSMCPPLLPRCTLTAPFLHLAPLLLPAVLPPPRPFPPLPSAARSSFFSRTPFVFFHVCTAAAQPPVPLHLPSRGVLFRVTGDARDATEQVQVACASTTMSTLWRPHTRLGALLVL